MDKAEICGPRDGGKNAAHVAKCTTRNPKQKRAGNSASCLSPLTHCAAMPKERITVREESERARERSTSAGALSYSISKGKSTAAIHIDVMLVR